MARPRPSTPAARRGLAAASLVAAALVLAPARFPKAAFAPLPPAPATEQEPLRGGRRWAGLSAAAAAAGWATGGQRGWAEEPPKPKVSVAVGLASEELVFPEYFVGEWGCVGELYKVETGSPGEAALATALPGAEESLRMSSKAVGTEAGNFRARRKWDKTTRSPPQAEGSGALEDRGGTSAGAFAAAEVLAGPGAQVKPVVGEENSFVVMVKGKRWRLDAAGAVERPDAEILDSFKVSELFQVSDPAKKDEAGGLSVRVVTVWRRVASDAKAQGESAEADEKLDTSRPYIAQAVQVAYLLPDPSAQNDRSLASYTTRFLYYPIIAS